MHLRMLIEVGYLQQKNVKTWMANYELSNVMNNMCNVRSGEDKILQGINKLAKIWNVLQEIPAVW